MTDPRLEAADQAYAAGQWDRAQTLYEQVLADNPRSAHAHTNLGALLEGRRAFEPAARHYYAAAQIEPGIADRHLNLANIMQSLGRDDDAAVALKRALGLSGDPGLKVRLATMIPTLMPDRAAILERRQYFLDQVTALTAHGISLADPMAQVGRTNMLLAYHGLDDRPLAEAVGRLYLTACPELGVAARHAITPGAIGRGKRLRLGIVSEHLHAHTIGRLYGRLIESLDKSLFEKILFLPKRPPDPLRARIVAAVDQVVELPSQLFDAQEAIAAAELDLLFYPDIGMAPLTYYLSFARLAPVQAVGWGHPDTVGSPAIDLFMSVAAMEPEGAQAHYGERLVSLPGMGLPYDPEPLTRPRKDRAGFGFSEQEILLICPQTLMKFHPDFDQLLRRVLGELPSAKLLLITSRSTYLDVALRQRIAGGNQRLAEQIQFLPILPTADFIDLIGCADVMLDPLHYSGGNTTLDAFTVGTPVVTWPGGFMRARHTYGFYQLMGQEGLVARDWDHYAELVLALARDRELRASWRQTIQASTAAIWADQRPVRAFEKVMMEAADAASRR